MTVLARPFPVRFVLLIAALVAANVGLARAEDRAPALAAGEPVKIVAIGSSSTAGAGASAPDKSYPARLAVELNARFPHQPITVINRGVNGEEAKDMVARLDEGVFSERPDLILWQVGANSVLRDNPILAVRSDILEGLRRMKASGADVILMDPQFAPKVLAKKDADAMVDLLATTAKAQNVDLFRRVAHERLELCLRGEAPGRRDRRGRNPRHADRPRALILANIRDNSG